MVPPVARPTEAGRYRTRGLVNLAVCQHGQAAWNGSISTNASIQERGRVDAGNADGAWYIRDQGAACHLRNDNNNQYQQEAIVCP